MIKSATGLKAKVRNISKGDSKTAQAIIKNILYGTASRTNFIIEIQGSVS